MGAPAVNDPDWTGARCGECLKPVVRTIINDQGDRLDVDATPNPELGTVELLGRIEAALVVNAVVHPSPVSARLFADIPPDAPPWHAPHQCPPWADVGLAGIAEARALMAEVG